MFSTHSRMTLIAIATVLLFVLLPMNVFAGSSSEPAAEEAGQTGAYSSSDVSEVVINEGVTVKRGQVTISEIVDSSHSLFKPDAIYDGSFRSELIANELPIYDAFYTMFVTNKKNDTVAINMSSMGYTSAQADEVFDLVASAYAAFYMDHPEVYWITGYRYNIMSIDNQIECIYITVKERYNGAYSQLSTVESGISSAVSNIRALRASGSRYDTVKAIHDYICNKMTYDYEAAQALMDKNYGEAHCVAPLFGGGNRGKKFVCEGYANSFKLLCEKFNIPAVHIKGNVDNPHSWNYVQMEDNRWYGVDCTWDDQSTLKYTYFLVGSSSAVFNGKTFGQDHVPVNQVLIDDTVYPLAYPLLASSAYVPKATVSATGITLSQTSLRLNKGDSATLTATVTPSESTDTVSWTSSNNAVVTVSDGVVTAVGNGNATITATAGSKDATCTVTVTTPATGITLSQTSLRLNKGDSAALTATVTPSESTDTVSWTSSNNAVATVSDGVVTAVGKGSATITATAGSKNATCAVTVNDKADVQLAIIQHPQNVQTLPGRLVTFSVTATGEGLSYQWYYKKANAAGWSVWRTFTEPTINPPANSTWNGMQVYCKVTDKNGNSVSSNPATVTILEPGESDFMILSQPASVTLNDGDTVTFRIIAKGSGLTYQWYYIPKDGSAWIKWNGHNTASTSAIVDQSWDGRQVYCVITDNQGESLYSEIATVTIAEKIKITRQPVNQTVKLGDSIKLSLKAEGGGLTYQWYFKKVGQSSFSPWKGHTHASEAVTPNATWNGIQLYCIVKDSTGKTVQSNTVTVKVTQNLKITVQPENKTVKLGDSVKLSLKAEGIGLTYQWYFKKAGQSSFSQWKGHTHASENVTPNATWNGIQLYCVVRDSSGKTVQSNTVTVKITQELKITAQPENKTVKLGDSVKLSLKAEGIGLTYQWYFKKAGQSSFSQWKGHTHASETVTPNATWNGIQLYCVVKDSSGKTVQSNVATITIK